MRRVDGGVLKKEEEEMYGAQVMTEDGNLPEASPGDPPAAGIKTPLISKGPLQGPCVGVGWADAEYFTSESRKGRTRRVF